MLDEFIGRQSWPIFAWQTTDFCWLILLADKIDQLYRSSDIPFSIEWVNLLSCVLCTCSWHPSLGEFRGKSEILSTLNLLRWKFEAVCWKIATYLPRGWDTQHMTNIRSGFIAYTHPPPNLRSKLYPIVVSFSAFERSFLLQCFYDFKHMN